jgi:hypothetical protein
MTARQFVDTRDNPITTDHYLANLTDVDRLRDLAIQYRNAMLGQHEFAAHLLASECAACERAIQECDPDVACADYRTWQAQYEAAVGAS